MLIVVKRLFEMGELSFFDCVREGFHLFKQSGHVNMEERLDLKKLSNKYEEKLKKGL